MTPCIKAAAHWIKPVAYGLAFLWGLLFLIFWPLAALGTDGLLSGGQLYPVFWFLSAGHVLEFSVEKWRGDMMSYIRAALLLAAYNIFAVGIVMLFGLPFRWSLVIAANAYLAAMAAVLWYAQRGD